LGRQVRLLTLFAIAAAIVGCSSEPEAKAPTAGAEAKGAKGELKAGGRSLTAAGKNAESRVGSATGSK